MIPNTEIKASLTSEFRLEQAMKKVGVEDAALVRKLNIAGTMTEADCRYIREKMGKTLQELDLSEASFEDNKIPYDAFAYCAITSVTIPASVIEIGEYAFLECLKLTSITAHPENPAYASIKGILFNKDMTCLIHCPYSKQGDCFIPASLTGYEFLMYINEECPGLTSITVHPDNPEFASENGVLFSKNKKRLISCPAGRKGDYVIPDTTVEIGNLAFYGCTGLTSITIPDTVVAIGRGAFHGCVDLESVTIPNSVKTIGYGAFSGCYGLSSVIMPDSGVKMGENVFSGCIRLDKLLKHYQDTTPPTISIISNTNSTFNLTY